MQIGQFRRYVHELLPPALYHLQCERQYHCSRRGDRVIRQVQPRKGIVLAQRSSQDLATTAETQTPGRIVLSNYPKVIFLVLARMSGVHNL